MRLFFGVLHIYSYLCPPINPKKDEKAIDNTPAGADCNSR